jgi:hypothetical protein
VTEVLTEHLKVLEEFLAKVHAMLAEFPPPCAGEDRRAA